MNNDTFLKALSLKGSFLGSKGSQLGSGKESQLEDLCQQCLFNEKQSKTLCNTGIQETQSNQGNINALAEGENKA